MIRFLRAAAAAALAAFAPAAAAAAEITTSATVPALSVPWRIVAAADGKTSEVTFPGFDGDPADAPPRATMTADAMFTMRSLYMGVAIVEADPVVSASFSLSGVAEVRMLASSTPHNDVWPMVRATWLSAETPPGSDPVPVAAPVEFRIASLTLVPVRVPLAPWLAKGTGQVRLKLEIVNAVPYAWSDRRLLVVKRIELR